MAEAEVTSVKTQPDSITHISTRKLQTSCWTALIAIAIVRAWLTRYFVNGDAISYLDIARMVAEGNAGAAVHAYWSPGYPVLLSFFLYIFHPGIYWECTLAHFVNVLIFAAALAGFQLFWREARLQHETYAGRGGAEIPERAFWTLGYSIFAIATLNVITVSFIGPDLLVAAFCCFAGWSALRIRRTPGVGHALLLGFVLALGYYAKAPFFPMGTVFILCASLVWPMQRRRILSGVLSLIIFLLLCTPYIAALSRAKGRLTFGESARVSHACYLDGVQKFQHWQGGPPDAGTPIHPTRRLNDFPQTYEFAVKDMGTYPPWFDPTYWYEGVTPRLHWKLQAKVLVANLIVEFQIVMESAAVLAVGVIMLARFACGHISFWQLWFVWMPGAIALLMFALVHVEPRFLGGWLVLLFGGAICACSLPPDGSAHRAVRWIGLAVLIASGAALASEASLEVLGKGYAVNSSRSCARIAAFLLNSGLHPGDRVAVIGDGVDSSYWAHLARLQIVAEIPANLWAPQSHPALDFWESGPEQQQKALRLLEQTGASAVIAGSQDSMPGSGPSSVSPPWEKIDGTWAAVYFFHENPLNNLTTNQSGR